MTKYHLKIMEEGFFTGEKGFSCDINSKLASSELLDKIWELISAELDKENTLSMEDDGRK